MFLCSSLKDSANPDISAAQFRSGEKLLLPTGISEIFIPPKIA
jgi:hypothetical protein